MLSGDTSIEADDAFLYATESNPGNVVKLAASTGMRSVIAAGQSYPIRLTLKAGKLYWSNYGLSNPGSIMAVDLTSGAPTVLATNLKYAKEIVSDGTSVFFTQQGATTAPCTWQSLWRVPVTGGTPFLLGCSNEDITTNIVVDANYIYFGTGQYLRWLRR